MAIDYLNSLTMESLLKENTLEDFGPYSISAGYIKTIKWGTVGLFDVEYKDRTLYISDWIESEEELKYKVDKAITKINTLKESLERVMKFTVVAYNKDADTYVDLFTTEDVHEAIVEAEKNAYLCLRDRLRDKDGEPFDWIEVVDERDKVYWASYDDFVPEVGAILTRERFDALVSNGDKTGHLATPSHNFIYYPDRGIVVTDRANPKKSTTIHIDDVKKGYDHIRDIDADKVLTESFRKGLNEGPGAGYTITSKGYNMQGSVSDVISVVYTDKGYVIKALCDFVGKVKEFKANSYYSGTGDVDNLPIHCDSFEIRIPLANDEVIEEITNGAKEVTKDNIDAGYLAEAVLDVLYTSECSFVYGGGYVHSKYDGQVNDYDHLDYDPYYFDDIKATIYLTNQEDIDKVDRMTQGYGYETIYSVIDDDYDVVDSFDNEEDAIVYAKENGYNEVRADYQYEDWDGNIDIDEGDTIWSSDIDESLKEGGPGSGDRRTAAQRHNDKANKIFQSKKNLDRAQAEYLRRLGVSEEEIIELTNSDRLQVKLIELGEKDNFYNKYDFKSGVLKESSNENSPKVKLTMNNFDSYEGGDTASYTVDNADTIKPYIIDIGYKTTFKFSDDLYQIKQDDIKKVEVVAMTQDDIYRTDVDVQVYIDIDDNMDLIYCGTYADSNDVKDVAMVEKIVNDWMRTGKTVKTIKEDFMMEGDGVKDYNKLFSEFLELIDFQLVENGDDSYTDANGDVHEGKWSLIDLQGGNIGGIEARRYANAADMIEDLDIYIDDYIFSSIIDSLKDVGIQSSYSDYRILRYRDELPDNEWDFDVLDMIANHADEIDLEKVDHNGFLPVEESLREDSRIGKTMSIDEIAELCGGYEQVQDIVDGAKENYPGIDCDELAEMTYNLCDNDEVSEDEWSSLIEYVCSSLEESLKESMTEIEFFPGDEGDLDAEEYVNEQGLADGSYEIEWDDVRKGYVLSVESDLPKEVELSIYDVGYVAGETDADELDEIISDYLSDNYGYCHNGFQFDVDGDTIYIYDIKWDMTESLKESSDVTYESDDEIIVYEISGQEIERFIE